MADFFNMLLDKIAWVLMIVQLPGTAYLVFGKALPWLIGKWPKKSS